MKVELHNRFSGKALIAVEVNCSGGTHPHRQLGLAAQAACQQGVSLRQADLTNADFRNLDLRGVDLSGAELDMADLSHVDLGNAKVLGASFIHADLNYADISEADLRSSDMVGAKLRDARLRGANLSDVDLSEANLTGADLSDVSFANGALRGIRLSNVPTIANIHQTVYAAAADDGGLDMATWRALDARHCWARWSIHLSGDTGTELEYTMGTNTAAALIYIASDPDLQSVPDFYLDDEQALKLMRVLAGVKLGQLFA